MTKYNYRKEVTNDIIDYINNEINLADWQDLDELKEYLQDTLWTEDSVTGNGSGSYTFSTYDAEENISHNWYLLQDALETFGYTNINILEKGAEWADVTIRCYLLPECIDRAIEEVTR